MPLYDYKCQEHGLFQELGTMAKPDIRQTVLNARCCHHG